MSSQVAQADLAVDRRFRTIAFCIICTDYLFLATEGYLLFAILQSNSIYRFYFPLWILTAFFVFVLSIMMMRAVSRGGIARLHARLPNLRHMPLVRRFALISSNRPLATWMVTSYLRIVFVSLSLLTASIIYAAMSTIEHVYCVVALFLIFALHIVAVTATTENIYYIAVLWPTRAIGNFSLYAKARCAERCGFKMPDMTETEAPGINRQRKPKKKKSNQREKTG